MQIRVKIINYNYVDNDLTHQKSSIVSDTCIKITNNLV